MLSKTPLCDLALSAKELGIREWERAGLLKFVELVEQGVITNDKFFHDSSAACIGFWVHRCRSKPELSERASMQYVNNVKSPLRNLYFPDNPNAYAKTAHEGAQMVRGFLMFGKTP